VNDAFLNAVPAV